MILDVLNAVLEVSIPLGKVMISEMPYETFGPFVEIFREAYLGLYNLLEDFKGIIMNKRTLAHKHLVNKNTESVPIHWLTMAFIHDNLRS